MSEKLTAVEWFANEIDNLIPYINENVSKSFNELKEQAIQMEKQQIIKVAARGFLAMPEKFNLNDAKEFGEQYYKNTYDTKRESN
jgi:ArsR family metal-binding transcriptional regulator